MRGQTRRYRFPARSSARCSCLALNPDLRFCHPKAAKTSKGFSLTSEGNIFVGDFRPGRAAAASSTYFERVIRRTTRLELVSASRASCAASLLIPAPAPEPSPRPPSMRKLLATISKLVRF